MQCGTDDSPVWREGVGGGAGQPDPSHSHNSHAGPTSGRPHIEASYLSTFIGVTSVPSLHAPMLGSTASFFPEKVASISASNVFQ